MLFVLFKFPMMDLGAASFFLEWRKNAMEHLMIYDIGDKVRWETRMIEQTMDLDQTAFKDVKPQNPHASHFPMRTAEPRNRQVKSIVEVLGIEMIIYRLQIIMFSFRGMDLLSGFCDLFALE